MLSGTQDLKTESKPETAGYHYYQKQCEKAKSENWLTPSNASGTAKQNEDGPKEQGGAPSFEPPNFCDLSAQYRSAHAAESSSDAAWSNYRWTLVGVVLLFCTLLLTAKALIEAEKTTKAVLNEQRPWLDFDIRSARTQTKDNFSVSLTIRNIGKTPAKKIRVFPISAPADAGIVWRRECLDELIHLYERNYSIDQRACLHNDSFAFDCAFERNSDFPNGHRNCNDLFESVCGAVIIFYEHDMSDEIACTAFVIDVAPGINTGSGGVARAITGEGFNLKATEHEQSTKYI